MINISSRPRPTAGVRGERLGLRFGSFCGGRYMCLLRHQTITAKYYYNEYSRKLWTKLLLSTTTKTTNVLRQLGPVQVSRHLHLRTEDFVGAKFYCPVPTCPCNHRIWIREKTLEFSSVLSAQSLCRFK